jgi:hypothetical protein
MWEANSYNGDEPTLHCFIRRKVMTTVIEAVFENGVFKPLVEADFKENHRYNGREVYRQAQDAGVKHPFMAHIEPADALPFGGW